MQTGYFYNLTKNEIKGAISIAVGSPRYVTVDLKLKELAPSWDLLQDLRNDRIDEFEYERRFNLQLSKLNPLEIYNKILKLTNDSEPVLMCHCKKENFCHRHLVAQWLEKNLNIKIGEYGIGEVKRENGKIIQN